MVSQYPKMIKRLFVINNNPSNLFGVRLFIEGSWTTILLDARFPVKEGEFVGVKPPKSDNCLIIWVMLL